MPTTAVPDPTTSAVLVLANSAAGSSDKPIVREVLATLRAEADVEIVVPAPGSTDLQRALARARGRSLVVLGGDGSIHACLQQLHDQRLLEQVGAIGLVPLGTGNDLARSQGLPQDPVEAATVAVHGRPTSMGLLLDDHGHVVVNVVHVGIAANASARAQDVKGLMGRTGYAVGAFRAGLGTSGWNLRVEVDGEEVLDGSTRTLMVSLALGRSVGGGARVAPEASPSDDDMDVVISTATGAASRLGFARDLRRSRHLERADVRKLDAQVVRIEAVGAGDAFRLNADGELGEHEMQVRTWTVAPRVWQLRVPQEH